MKKCPYCAEEILEEAIKCKHCGSALTGEAKPEYQEVKKGIKQVKWDKFKFNLKIFFATIASIIVGFVAGIIWGQVWGWSAGLVLFAALGIKSMCSYFEFGKNKK